MVADFTHSQHSSNYPHPAHPVGTPRTLANVSETQLLSEVFTAITAAGADANRLQHSWPVLVGVGDDAAVLSRSGLPVSVSTDILVEGQHFRTDWSSAHDIGRRAVMQNLADIAAMGGAPRAVFTSVVLPSALTVDWVVELSGGLASACAKHGVAMLGGDVVAGPNIVINVTVMGLQPEDGPVLRSTARSSDTVAFAGDIGWSAAGLAWLSAGTHSHDDAHVARALANFRCPNPPIELGPLAGSAGATSMMDISDGLLRDASRIAKASGVHLHLHDPRQTFRQELADLRHIAQALGHRAPDELALEWILTGGEDHGLLATFPAGSALPSGFREIGVVQDSGLPADREVSQVASGEAGVSVANWGQPSGAAHTQPNTGWDHFKPQQPE